MKHQKVIAINQDEYRFNKFFLWSQLSNSQRIPNLNGFIQSSKRPPSFAALMRLMDMLDGMADLKYIATAAQENTINDKCNRLLSHFTNVKDQRRRIRYSTTPGVAFEVDIEFEGDEKPLDSGATASAAEENQNLMEGGSMDGLLEDSVDVSEVK